MTAAERIKAFNKLYEHLQSELSGDIPKSDALVQVIETAKHITAGLLKRILF